MNKDVVLRGDGTRIISPMQFAEEFMLAVVNDPGSERKAMLFYLDGEEIAFVAARSEARVTVIEFTRKG